MRSFEITGIYKISSPSGAAYIGQSRRMRERWACYRRNKSTQQVRLNRSLKKYGPENHHFEIIHELPKDVSQEVLNEYEILYIDLYRSTGIQLLNIRDGGSKGAINADSKNRISLALLGNEPWNKGKTSVYSDATLKVMAARKLGGTLTEDHKKKIAHNSYPPNRRAVLQYDQNGNLIKEWISIGRAGVELNIQEQNLGKVCRGERKTAGGFTWKYKNQLNGKV